MSIHFVRNDISKMEVDAVVLPANEYLRKGPGSSSALFEAAGEKELEAACRKIGYLPMGEAAVTDGFNLKSEYIIHAVVPLWQGGSFGEEKYLRNAYRNALARALEKKMESIAFPLLSSGNFGYPKDEAIDIAVDEISSFLEKNEMDIYIVLYGQSDLNAATRFTDDIDEYIDNNYVQEQKRIIYGSAGTARYFSRHGRESNLPCMSSEYSYNSIDEIDFKEEKNFSETLLDLIDQKGMSDPEAYHASNMDRKLFNKIKNSMGYTPKKNTVLSLCIGLRLSISESEDLLSRAGYAFSPCSKSDIVVKYFLETGKYRSIHDVNIALFERNLPTLN